MEISARLKGFRISAQKARLVVNQIRGKGVEDALNILALSDKKFSKPLEKLVQLLAHRADVVRMKTRSNRLAGR